jgi:SAM-dependent methyltransferase
MFNNFLRKFLIKLLSKFNSKFIATIRSKISYRKKDAKLLNEHDKNEAYDKFKLFFSKLIIHKDYETILDFGCGTGRYLQLFKDYKLIYLVDISRHNLKYASKNSKKLNLNYKTYKKSLNSLNFKVDCFFSTGVFGQYYQFDEKVVEKIFSLLNFGGKAVLQVKVKDDITDEVLAVDELEIIEILKNYDYKLHKKYFTGISNIEEYFYIVELFKN